MRLLLCTFVVFTAIVHVWVDAEINTVDRIRERTTLTNTSIVNATASVQIATTIAAKATTKPTTTAPKSKFPRTWKALKDSCKMFCRRTYNRRYFLPDCRYVKNKWGCQICRRILRCSTIVIPL